MRGGVCVLVGVTVFKTDEAEYLGLAGSIPVLLRDAFARRAISGESAAAGNPSAG
jgi:hypothetical protein